MKVKVIGQGHHIKTRFSRVLPCISQGQEVKGHKKVTSFKVKGHMKVTWFKVKVSSVKVTWVRIKGHIGQCQIRILKKGRWAHNNVKLLHLC